MSTAPYPHVEISVRDESIYTPIETENLPLNKPLYMMRTLKGPVGVPVWCDTYTKAVRVFGEDTFNKRSQYFSEQAYFLLKTFPSNGAFIMRVADTNAKSAVISIELGISKTVKNVPQWQRDANGRFVLELDGSKIPWAAATTEKPYPHPCEPVPGSTPTYIYTKAAEAVAIDAHQPYYSRTSTYTYVDVGPNSRRVKGVEYWKANDSALPLFSEVTASETFDPNSLYFEYTAGTGGADDIAVPKFDLTAFESGKVYIKFTGYTTGYRQATETELPAIIAGQTIGDRFNDKIDATSILVEVNTTTATGDYIGKIDTTAVTQKWFTYFFTIDDSKTVHTYTELSIPTGTPLSDGTYYYRSGELQPGVLEPQATLPGHKLAWRAHVRSSYVTRPIGTTTPEDSDNFTWYPMLDVAAENPGQWGDKFGMRLFFDIANNTVSGILANSAVTYTIAPVELVGDDTTPTSITDAYGQTMVTGVMRKGAYDAVTDVELCLDKRLAGSYSGNYALPIQVTYIYENWDKVGKIIMKDEISNNTATGGDVRAQISALYPDFRKIINAEGTEVAETFVDALFEKVATDTDIDQDDVGYMANLLSCIDGENIPYFCSAVVDATDDDIKGDTKLNTHLEEIITPSAETAIFIKGGTDGDIDDYSIEKFIRAQITATIGQTQEYLIDYARCPFNCIYDTGVSLKTKKAYCDLMSVRDSLVVNLTCQQTWKNQDGTTPKLNGRYDDESIGSALRSYAWLMREDVANGTECCRCKIFLHAGYTSDRDLFCASTLWMAMKDAQYLNKRYIDQEAKELPNAAVECWTKLSWVAASEDTKSRCWNAGLNYVQYYDMTHWHYASVRSVYRYETSILVDGGVVNALTFMKDEVRRSWATWSGSTRPAAELNLKITEDLSARYSYLLNGKYQFAVSVYQTDEDMKLGYVRHVDIQLISPATNRVWLATIICKRENFNTEA